MLLYCRKINGQGMRTPCGIGFALRRRAGGGKARRENGAGWFPMEGHGKPRGCLFHLPGRALCGYSRRRVSSFLLHLFPRHRRHGCLKRRSQVSFMPWSDKFILGIAKIDEQHHWLVDATNRLYDQVESHHPDPAVVQEVLEGLVDYTFNHFILEEDLFLRYGYPATVGHKHEHDDFTRRAYGLLRSYEEGHAESVGTDALEFLKEWLAHHILVVDKAYVPFLKAKGLG
jgi:hemerythrin